MLKDNSPIFNTWKTISFCTLKHEEKGESMTQMGGSSSITPKGKYAPDSCEGTEMNVMLFARPIENMELGRQVMMPLKTDFE